MCGLIFIFSIKSIAQKLNMLTVNQINAQVKLTEMWKASNDPNYPLKINKKDISDDKVLTRSNIRGDIVIQGKNEMCNASLMSRNIGETGDIHTCYPFDLCYSKCRFSTDRIKQRSRV